jgi:hypothetical protein
MRAPKETIAAASGAVPRLGRFPHNTAMVALSARPLELFFLVKMVAEKVLFFVFPIFFSRRENNDAR